jgi:outer membrane protein TolC
MNHPGRACIFGLILTLGAVVSGGAQEVYDLEHVVDVALADNPAYQATVERRQQLQGAIKEAKADAFPQLTLSSFYDRSRNPSLLNSPDFADFIQNLPPGVDFTPREQTLYGLRLEVSQPLFTWGKIGAAVRLARLAAEAAEAQIDAAGLDTAERAARAYFQLLGAREALATVKIQRQARQEALDVVRARLELGDATRLEVLQAEAALAEVEPQIAASEGAVEVAQAALKTALGLSTSEQIDVRPAVRRTLPDVPPREALLALAQRERSELTDLERQDQALGMQRKVRRAEGRPHLDLDGNYGRTVRELQNLDQPLYDDWRVGITLSWEFFDGNRRRGQIAQIESQRQQLRYQRQNLQNQIDLEVDQAWNGYRTARQRLAASERSVAAAREARRVAEENYREGVALQADLLSAQERETSAEVESVRARYDAWDWAVQLARAVGYLPTRVAELGSDTTNDPAGGAAPTPSAESLQ